MIIFLFVLIIVGYSFELKGIGNKNGLLKLLLASIVFIEAIKLNSGTDYWNYYNHYVAADKSILWHDNNRFEPGYSVLVLIFKNLTFSFSQFLVFFFGILYSLYYFSLKKVTNFPITGLLVILGITIGYLGSNRQLMAVAVIFASTVFFYKKKIVWGLCIVVASLFHYSGIVTHTIVLLNREIRPLFLILGLVICSISVFSGLNYKIIRWLSAVIYMKDNYEFYLTHITVRSGINSWITLACGIMRRIAPIVLLYVFSRQLNGKKLYPVVLNVHLFSLFLFVFSINNIDVLSARLSLYLIIFEAITYSWFLAYLFKAQNRYRYYIATGLVMFVLIIAAKAIGHYPHLFIPYKTIFGTF